LRASYALLDTPAAKSRHGSYLFSPLNRFPRRLPYKPLFGFQAIAFTVFSTSPVRSATVLIERYPRMERENPDFAERCFQVTLERTYLKLVTSIIL
jgi:hypothetical protein